MWLQWIGSVMALVGVVFIFEGRRVVKKHFPDGDENTATLGIKILGFFIALIGCAMMITW